MTLLSVEDLEFDRMFIERSFRKSGQPVKVVFVHSAEEAMAYLGKCGTDHGLPALVLTDLKLSGLSGFELIEWIRGQHQFDQLPVGVLSSSELLADVDRAKQCGAQFYLKKPSVLNDYKDVVRRVLGYLPTPKVTRIDKALTLCC